MVVFRTQGGGGLDYESQSNSHSNGIHDEGCGWRRDEEDISVLSSSVPLVEFHQTKEIKIELCMRKHNTHSYSFSEVGVADHA